MAESGADGSRLEMLRERWERDPASRLFLQLAEEYRRDGRPAEAVKVLETGLGHHPGYLAARVALGRCRLETGDAAGAAEALEQVIAADPTQLVANKLLIATYLRLERTSEARDRLDLYTLLNEADPEIDGLERQLMAAEAAAGPTALPDLPTAYGELVEIARRPGGGEAPPSPEPFQPAAEPLPLAPRPPVSLDLESLPLPGVARRRIDAAALPPPFPSLVSPPSPPGAAPWVALAAAGIFRWQAAAAVSAPAPAAEEEEPRPLAEPLAGEPLEVELEVEEAPALPPAARWWEAREPVPQIEPQIEPEPEPEVEPEIEAELPAGEPPVAAFEAEAAPAVEEAAAQPWWQLPQAEPPAAIAPPEPEVLEPEVPEPDAWEPVPSGSPEPSFPEAAAPAEPLGSVEPPFAPEPASELTTPALDTWEAEGGSEPAAGEEATTTLAELYLQQGHLAEAEAAFATVLARRPGDPAAEAGLVRIAERRSLPLGAAGLLASDEAPAGLTGRKVLLLQRYLQRIREGAKRHVP
ncbi:MAG TPA: tetratricopeptide repeat protein [Thermoanaerobaculia bacterium]|nr:tetratricopeptide repeat protein [Thermoanaerobaculia bacterium]